MTSLINRLLENPLAYDSVCGHKTNKYNVYYMENTAFENSASSALVLWSYVGLGSHISLWSYMRL